ncbi:hypothetical protein ACU635_61075 [[Actinomadura] parvosata]|uniref:hypothetical protein n=1 Tax=[Actinomadura] parvosata TaxID=1955412 RepID=UPI00406C4D88
MDLIVLVYGDPWTPGLPPGTAIRPGLTQPFIVSGLILLLVLSRRRSSADGVRVHLLAQAAARVSTFRPGPRYPCPAGRRWQTPSLAEHGASRLRRVRWTGPTGPATVNPRRTKPLHTTADQQNTTGRSSSE